MKGGRGRGGDEKRKEVRGRKEEEEKERGRKEEKGMWGKRERWLFVWSEENVCTLFTGDPAKGGPRGWTPAQNPFFRGKKGSRPLSTMAKEESLKKGHFAKTWGVEGPETRLESIKNTPKSQTRGNKVPVRTAAGRGTGSSASRRHYQKGNRNSSPVMRISRGKTTKKSVATQEAAKGDVKKRNCA